MDINKEFERIRKKYHTDSAYDEWLEEHLDEFDTDEEEIEFANYRLGSGKKVRAVDDVSEVENAWKEFKLKKDGGQGSGNFGHKGRPGGGSLPGEGGSKLGVSDLRTADKNWNLSGFYDSMNILKEHKIKENKVKNNKNKAKKTKKK